MYDQILYNTIDVTMRQLQLTEVMKMTLDLS